ncbi:hypothetical protein [Paraburkholderia fungorum]|uniref:hypothetical protein n=1 Tax=Paraburkholderia fungorum TaxID=134537 RepID=UPI00209B9FD2|nr:hypothetical protein [Paraburkholderia fungorum]
MTSNVVAEAETRAKIERLYEAFSRHDLALLRDVVTADWEYLPEPKGQRPVRTRWPRYSTTSRRHCPT